MDGASFWSALTKPSVFSYAAKALILISLFPSGLNLWSETPGLLGVEVLKCMCAILFSIQGQIHCYSCRHTLPRCPQTDFSSLFMQSSSCSWQQQRYFLRVLLRCTGDAARPTLEIKSAGSHPRSAGPKGSSFKPSSLGQWRKSPRNRTRHGSFYWMSSPREGSVSTVFVINL